MLNQGWSPEGVEAMTSATAAMAEMPHIELPHATSIAIFGVSPRSRLEAKDAPIATIATATMSKISIGPAAAPACRLTDAPSGTTAISHHAVGHDLGQRRFST
jgi:hypothetical protein